MMILIAVFGFHTCYQQGLMLRYGEDENSFEYDVGLYSASKKEEQPGAFSRWKTQRKEIRRKRDAERHAATEVDLDRVLAKI